MSYRWEGRAATLRVTCLPVVEFLRRFLELVGTLVSRDEVVEQKSLPFCALRKNSQDWHLPEKQIRVVQNANEGDSNFAANFGVGEYTELGMCVGEIVNHDPD